MAGLKLIIGNKNYSSWSLRPWLAMRQAGIAFEEELALLDFDGNGPGNEHLKAFSPAGRVPVLFDGDLAVWESLAILEYVAELHPDAGLWPDDRAARARARVVSNEMHAGFGALRSALPMNMRRNPSKVPVAADVDADISRIQEAWADCLANKTVDGPFLFGRFSIADAMYAPVVSRFEVYDIALIDAVAPYAEAVLSLPAFREWKSAAEEEPWVIEQEEI